MELSDTWVLDTLQSLNGKYGDGIKAELSGVLISAAWGGFPMRIEGSARAGVSTAGRHPAGLPVKLEDVQIACNAIDRVGEDVPADFFDTGVPAATSEYLFADVGGNVCGCGGVTVSCQVDSPTLEPPAPIPAP